MDIKVDYIERGDYRVKEEIKSAIKILESKRELIYKRYYEGYTQSELSKSLGMSQVQISRKENKVLEKLKVKL